LSLITLVSKRTPMPTPWPVKAAVVLGAWFLLGGVRQMSLWPAVAAVETIASVLLQVASLLALWNMRRWAVLAQVVFLAYGILILRVLSGNWPGSTVLVGISVMRLLVAVPGFIYWRRMRW